MCLCLCVLCEVGGRGKGIWMCLRCSWVWMLTSILSFFCIIVAVKIITIYGIFSSHMYYAETIHGTLWVIKLTMELTATLWWGEIYPITKFRFENRSFVFVLSNYKTIHATSFWEITHAFSGHLQLSHYDILFLFTFLHPQHVLPKTGECALSITLHDGAQRNMATHVFPISTASWVCVQFLTCQWVIWMPSRANKGRKVTLAILIPTRPVFRAIAFVHGI